MTSTFKPLLAAAVEDISALRYPLLASPKLDGIRCVKLDGKALTRALKPIPNTFVREWVEANLLDGMDGELMLRDLKRPFNEVTSAIMSRDGEPDFVFMAFDFLSKGWSSPAEEIPFQHRLSTLEIDRKSLGGKPEALRFQVVPHTRVSDVVALSRMMAYHLEMGYEGTMVRDPNGRYKFGRSTLKEGILLKLKPFADAEAFVVGVVEQMHNTNEATINELGRTKRSSAKEGKVGTGKLGTLVCKTFGDAVEFEIGTGFTDEQRRNFWLEDLVGRTVKFKYQAPPGGRPVGVAPRGPAVFLGWRED